MQEVDDRLMMPLLIEEVKKYFSLKELVSKKTYEKYGETAWSFFDLRALTILVWLRKFLGIPLVCNNWASGGQLEQRGFRSNVDPLVSDKTKSGKLYCTAHARGMAFDLSSPKMAASEMRRQILKHKDMVPCPIRLEDDVTWLHIDVCNITEDLVTLFTV